MLLYFILSLWFYSWQGFDWISFDINKRVNKQGMTTEVEGKIYFQKNGDMLTHFFSPMEVFVFNNREGEIKLYNPQENTVVQRVNFMLGSRNTNFYHFLNGSTGEMGLDQMQFKLESSRLENKLLISLWKAPESGADQISMVELVHQGNKPVFMGYLDAKENYLKKVYYYDYQDFGTINFPGAITEIDYVGKDSVLSKTSFQNFQMNREEDLEMLNFELPEGVEVLK
jgi:hypothetical protein